jgi:hypothetical protein
MVHEVGNYALKIQPEGKAALKTKESTLYSGRRWLTWVFGSGIDEKYGGGGGNFIELFILLQEMDEPFFPVPFSQP